MKRGRERPCAFYTRKEMKEKKKKLYSFAVRQECKIRDVSSFQWLVQFSHELIQTDVVPSLFFFKFFFFQLFFYAEVVQNKEETFFSFDSMQISNRVHEESNAKNKNYFDTLSV